MATIKKDYSLAAFQIFLSLLFLFFSSWYSPPPLEASEPARMEEVVVTAQPEEEPEAQQKDPASFVTVIESKDFEESLRSVPQVLQQYAGVNIRRFGGLGGFSTASIRGSSAEQVAIFIDGVPLNRGKSGVVNLGTVPIGTVERIEVFRGVAPLRFRTTAAGGVINIVTKQIKAKRQSQVGGAYGSFSTYNVNANTTGKIKKIGLLAAADFTGSKGNFKYLDDNGTRFNPNDDEITERRNNQFDSMNLLGRVSYDFTDAVRAEISDNFFKKDEGVPGLGAFQSETANLKTDRNIFNVKLNAENVVSPDLEADALLYLLNEKTRFQDLDGEIGTGRQDNTNDQLSFGLDGHLTYFLGESQIIEFILSYQNERFDSEDPLSSVEPIGETQQRTAIITGASDKIYLWDDRVILTPQLMYTYLMYDFGGRVPFSGKEVPTPENQGYFTPQIGARLGLTEYFALKTNGGRYFRFPNFSELFGDRGGIIGNPELEPEEGVNFDIGLTAQRRKTNIGLLSIDRAYLEGAYFFRDTENLIALVQTSQRTARAVNISSARVQGFELRWGLDLFNHFSFFGNYTYQLAENTSDIPFLRGNRLPGIPEHQFFARLEAFNRWVRPFYEYNFIGNNYLDEANFELVEERSIHNLGITVYPKEGLSLTFEVRNLTDEQISDVLGFPLPGRAYIGTLLFKF